MTLRISRNENVNVKKVFVVFYKSIRKVLNSRENEILLETQFEIESVYILLMELTILSIKIADQIQPKSVDMWIPSEQSSAQFIQRRRNLNSK